MNELQQELKRQIFRFCQEQIEPTVHLDDQNSLFRPEIFAGIANLGLTGIPISENYGGQGLGYQDFIVALEELAKSSVPYAITLSVSTMVQAIIQSYGTEIQKQTYLPALCTGKEIGAFALSESFAGSDAASLKTTAKKVDGGYLLNGSKMWITSGGIAKTYIVMARTGKEGASGISAFIVRDGTPGFEFGKKEDKMGWKISPTRELLFKDCFIPKENLLGEEGMGFTIAMSALDRGRITIGAIAVGLSQKALDVSLLYSLTREQFNQPIYNFQGLQFMISEMSTEIESSRLLVEKAAFLFDQGTPNIKLASMAKLKSTDTAMSVTTNAVQILGGVGYTTEYPLERYMRDAKVLQIVEGTNQIQKVIIARELKRDLMK